MRRIFALAILVSLGAGLLAGCGERDQTVQYKNGKYRGKPDTPPWDNAPSAYGSPDWKKGDEAGWENGVRQRMQTQNEYGRIGH